MPNCSRELRAYTERHSPERPTIIVVIDALNVLKRVSRVGLLFKSRQLTLTHLLNEVDYFRLVRIEQM